MIRAAFALLSGMAMAPLLTAQSMPEAAAQLALRISSLLPRRAIVSLEFQSPAALAPAESSSFRTALEQELRKAGMEVAAEGQPDSRVRVTISENARGLLFVAAIGSDENRQVAMLPWTAPPPTEIKPRVKIAIQTVREQPEAVLDILLLESGSEALVLGTSKVSNYRLISGKWTPSGAVNISLTSPLPRDARGRLEGDTAGFHVYLPGTTCTGALQPELKLTCAQDNETWLANPRDPALAVRWVTDRNLLESDSVKSQFYSAAAGWFAGPAGRVEDRAGDPLANANGWGSDLASIENPCGAGGLVLATKAGDAGDRDEIQAFEIADGQAVAQSEPVRLPGPVLAFWAAETSGQATVVIRNSKTGNYEASRLGLACIQ